MKKGLWSQVVVRLEHWFTRRVPYALQSTIQASRSKNQLKFGAAFHIFSRMKQRLRLILASPRARRVYLLLIVCFILFFLFNDIILPWYVNEGGIVVVPSVLGMPYDDAIKSLASMGLEGRKGDVRLDKAHPAGIV